jgi:hypothetical protein
MTNHAYMRELRTLSSLAVSLNIVQGTLHLMSALDVLRSLNYYKIILWCHKTPHRIPLYKCIQLLVADLQHCHVC